MESGSPAARRATICRRVGSPSAAKTGADCRNSALIGIAEVFPERLHLLDPALGILLVGLGGAPQRDAFEPRFDDGAPLAPRLIGEPELDMRRLLAGGR